MLSIAPSSMCCTAGCSPRSSMLVQNQAWTVYVGCAASGTTSFSLDANHVYWLKYYPGYMHKLLSEPLNRLASKRNFILMPNWTIARPMTLCDADSEASAWRFLPPSCHSYQISGVVPRRRFNIEVTVSSTMLLWHSSSHDHVPQ